MRTTKKLINHLKYSRLYFFVRYSNLYNIYLSIFRSSIYTDRKNEFKFYKSLSIPKTALIFDIGANIGDKTYLFSKLTNKVIGVEPDNLNYGILLKRFSASKKITVVNVAVGDKIASDEFYVTSDGCPANTLSTKWKGILEEPSKNRWSKSLTFETSYKVEILTLERLIADYGKPYYIKVDVEGYELNVIKGLKHIVPIISFEANLPEFREETIQCAQLLSELSLKVTFNCLTARHIFIWDQNKSLVEIIEWLNETNLKYFEVFAFNLTVSNN